MIKRRRNKLVKHIPQNGNSQMKWKKAEGKYFLKEALKNSIKTRLKIKENTKEKKVTVKQSTIRKAEEQCAELLRNLHAFNQDRLRIEAIMLIGAIKYHCPESSLILRTLEILNNLLEDPLLITQD